MQSPIDKQVIRRYLRGECTPQERQQVRDLMQSGQAQDLFDEVLKEGWIEEIQGTEETDAHQLAEWKAKFQQRIKQQQENQQQHQQRIIPVRNSGWVKYAAIWTMVILGAGSATWLYSKKAQHPAVAVLQETVSPNGRLVKITLSDSTIVTLNAGSKLSYPTTFSGKTRQVYLEGEAFFDVAQDPAHPFSVHTSRIRVDILGTSFDVRSYQNDSDISVAVTTGKVNVMANEQGSRPYTLLPGDKISYAIAGTSPELAKADPEETSAWQSAKLICRDETLENISRQLERWYDVKFIFKRKDLRQLRFTLKQKNDRLENVMQTLQFAGGIRYTLSQKTVTIW